jgi:hypothetical protein
MHKNINAEFFSNKSKFTLDGKNLEKSLRLLMVMNLVNDFKKQVVGEDKEREVIKQFLQGDLMFDEPKANQSRFLSLLWNKYRFLCKKAAIDPDGKGRIDMRIAL